MSPNPPSLRWSPSVVPYLDDPEAISVLFSILADPNVDGRHKFDEVFPYRPGTRALMDDSWYVVYSVDENGSVTVHRMFRRKQIDAMLG